MEQMSNRLWVSLLTAFLLSPCTADMPISLEQWRLAVGLWNARIQRTLVIRRGVKRAASNQESPQSHSGEKMFKAKKKARKKHKDDAIGDPAGVTTEKPCNELIVLEAPMVCTGGNKCKGDPVRNPVGPLLELLGCTVLGVLLVVMMLLLRSGDVETNPGPVEGGRWTVCMSSEACLDNS